MEEKKIEVRSERVRGIVGQMPRHLAAVALSVISAALLLTLGIACFLPYKEVYSGTAVLYGIAGGDEPVDLKLRFGDKRPSALLGGETIALRSADGIYLGTTLSLEQKRDTLGRQTAQASFPETLPGTLENSEVDFTLSSKSSPLIRHIFAAKKTPPK